VKADDAIRALLGFGSGLGVDVRQRRWPSVRRLVLAFLVGLIVGVGGFLVTGITGPDQYMGFCYPIVRSGFDPLDGLPYGVTLYCPGNALVPAPSPSTIYVPMSADFAARRALPVPLGFVIGAGLVLVVPVGRGRRQPG
jgi:hypothetical protein